MPAHSSRRPLTDERRLPPHGVRANGLAALVIPSSPSLPRPGITLGAANLAASRTRTAQARPNHAKEDETYGACPEGNHSHDGANYDARHDAGTPTFREFIVTHCNMIYVRAAQSDVQCRDSTNRR